ncbi:MAG: HEPN domain-containing protein [Candidatus Edwardsbacteria bacterium]
MASRWVDWLEQAKRDLAHAQKDTEEKFYEWACFSAQQSAEKAVKALYLFRNMEAWGHSVSSLLKNLATDVPEDLIEKGARLDRFYIPTRYANSFETGTPKEYFFKNDAEEAIKNASEIIKYCESLLPK